MRLTSTRRVGSQRRHMLAMQPGFVSFAALLVVAPLACSSNGSNPAGGGPNGSQSSSSSSSGSANNDGEPGGTGSGATTGPGGSSSSGSGSGGSVVTPSSSSSSSGGGLAGSSSGPGGGGSGSGSGGGGSNGGGGATPEGGTGGGGAEGGTVVAPSGDGGSFPTCAGTTFKFCEDFETGTAGALPTNWTQYKGYGAASPMNVLLDTSEAHSGLMSLKSDDLGKTGAARAQRSLATLSGTLATTHWGRIFYKVESPAPKPTGGVWHNTWTSLYGAMGENRIVDTVENTGGMHQWLYNLPSDGCSEGSAYNWGYDTAWHCAEWYVDVTANAYRFFTDGTEVTSIGFTGKTCDMMSNPYTAIIVGSTSYQTPTSPWIMWFDDLAINDTQIGCTQ